MRVLWWCCFLNRLLTCSIYGTFKSQSPHTAFFIQCLGFLDELRHLLSYFTFSERSIFLNLRLVVHLLQSEWTEDFLLFLKLLLDIELVTLPGSHHGRLLQIDIQPPITTIVIYFDFKRTLIFDELILLFELNIWTFFLSKFLHQIYFH